MKNILLNGNKSAFWVVVGTMALGMNLVGLYLQHFMDLQPCVKCIDQRIAFYLIAISSYLASACSSYKILFHTSRFATIASSSYATYLAINHHIMASNPNPFAMTCALDPNLPSWLPLHEWLPSLFGITGMCGETSMKLLGMGLVQWTMIGAISLTIYVLLGTFGVHKLFIKKNT